MMAASSRPVSAMPPVLPARPRESTTARIVYAAKILHAAGLIDVTQLRACLRGVARSG